jgi:putative SOS response-associated peptidase YedK
MVMMRWGMPPPPRAGNLPVTNIRNTSSPHGALGSNLKTAALYQPTALPNMPEPSPDTGKKDVVWFALNDERPLFAFAGIWTEFKGDRGNSYWPMSTPSSTPAQWLC